jgi:hypothetical protein
MGRPEVPEEVVISIPYHGTEKMVHIDLWGQTARIDGVPVVYVNPSIEKDNNLEPIPKEIWRELMCECDPSFVKELANSARFVVIGWEVYVPIVIHFSHPKNGYQVIYMSPM